MTFTVHVNYDSVTGQLVVVPSITMQKWLDSNQKQITSVFVKNTNDRLFGGNTFK